MHAKTHRLGKFAPLLLLAALTVLLTACPGISGGGGGNGGAPQISSFTANPATIAAAGQAVTLSWTITGSPTNLSISGSDGTNLSSLSGTNYVVNPTTTTTYTLTATNSSGNDTETTTVTVGGTVTPPTDGSRTVSFGVSLSQTGPFDSDAGSNISAGDPRIVNVAPGNTFYASVSYSGPSPVTGVTIYLANSSPANFKSDLVTGTNVNGFTLNEAVGGCATDGTQTSITCIYPISVASDASNITALPGAGSEFAYVLRTRVTDTTGTVYDQPPRGYVTVGGSSGGGTPPTNPPPTNPPPTNPPPTNPPPTNPPPTNPPPTNPPPTNPPGNSAPTVSIGGDESRDVETGESTTLTATGKDANGDTLTYQWSVAPSTGVTFSASKEARTNVEFANEGDYTVTVTVSDGKGGTGKDTVRFDVNDGDDDATPVPGFSVNIQEVDPILLGANGSASVLLQATVNNSPTGGTTTYRWTATGENPGDVSFASSISKDTRATFTVSGTYTLRLTATNGTSTFDTVSVVVRDRDLAKPTVTINQAANQDDPANSSPIRFTVTFSEEVTGFTNSDVTIGGSTTATAAVSGSGAVYTVSVTGMTTDDVVTASIAADKVTDSADNSNSASTSRDNSVVYEGP